MQLLVVQLTAGGAADGSSVAAGSAPARPGAI